LALFLALFLEREKERSISLLLLLSALLLALFYIKNGILLNSKEIRKFWVMMCYFGEKCIDVIFRTYYLVIFKKKLHYKLRISFFSVVIRNNTTSLEITPTLICSTYTGLFSFYMII
jgi:hypothetical protein